MSNNFIQNEFPTNEYISIVENSITNTNDKPEVIQSKSNSKIYIKSKKLLKAKQNKIRLNQANNQSKNKISRTVNTSYRVRPNLESPEQKGIYLNS